MLTSSKTTYVLMVINLALILFVMIRAGADELDPVRSRHRPLTFHKLEPVDHAAPDTLVLNDFERANDKTNMYWQGGEFTKRLTSGRISHGETSLEITRKIDDNIELATVHFPRQWDGYNALEFDLYNDADSVASVWVRVGNRYDARKFYIDSQKYARDFTIGPGWNTISIPLADIAEAFGRLPNRKSLHFNFPPGGSGRFFIDYLRVVRYVSSDK